MSIDRRQFIASSAAALGASVLTANFVSAAPADGQQLPIVDCHQHLWNLEQFKLPWIKPGTLLGKTYSIDDYLAAAKGLGIDRAVYMEVDVAPAQQQAEADAIIALCRTEKYPTVGAVISGRPAAANFRSYITPLGKNPEIKGVRQVLHAGSAAKGLCLQKEFVAGIRLLGELGLSFDLCMRSPELPDGGNLADECRDTQFILDHCGNADVNAFMKSASDADKQNADVWRRDIAALAERKNIVCKISGIIARVPKEWSAADLAPIVNHCLDSFGPDRVVFGSDWPVCLGGASLREWVVALREIIAERPIEQQRKLLSQNAERIYRLK
jgi:predicted TIM-barrel fold metal-dependent hydrolase